MFINGAVCGDSTIEIFEVAEIQNAKKGSITFLGNKMYNKYLETTSASAMIVSDKKLIKGNVEITSQNHGFEVVRSSLKKNIQITHQSLFDNSIEGIKLKNKPVYSVQYHPESNPGPQDSVYLFKEFINSMKKYAKKKRY